MCSSRRCRLSLAPAKHLGREPLRLLGVKLDQSRHDARARVDVRELPREPVPSGSGVRVRGRDQAVLASVRQ